MAREVDASLRPPTERLVLRHGKLVVARVEPVAWRSDVEKEFFERMAKNLTKREQKLKVGALASHHRPLTSEMLLFSRALLAVR